MRHSPFLIALVLAGCAPAIPDTMQIAARDVGSDQLFIGTVQGIRGEPTAEVALVGTEGNLICRGMTGVGGVSKVEPGITARLTLQCQDGRIIYGRIRYDGPAYGVGEARDTKAADYQVMLGRLSLTENELRREFAALPPPSTAPRPALVPATPTPGPTERDVGEPPLQPGVVSRPDIDCKGERLDGSCLDDFELDDFDGDNLDQFLRERDRQRTPKERIDA